MASGEPSVQVEDLVKTFAGQRAVDQLNLCVAQGQVLGLLGPNGAGKTTTIRILTTLLRPDSGRVRVAGYDVVEQPMQVRRRIAVTGQAAAVDDELTGRENLELIGTLLHLGRTRVRRRAVQLLDRFDLASVADRRARTYSGGLRRRLDLAACLVGTPPVLFLDEPTTGLDPASRLGLWEAVRDAVDEGTSLVLTTQYLEEADALCDRVAVISAGRMVAEGSPDELKRKVGQERLVVTVSQQSDWDDAVRALRGCSGDALELDHRKRTIVASLTDPLAGAGAAASELSAAGITVDEFALRSPTLDEVFLHLIGPAGPGLNREAAVDREAEMDLEAVVDRESVQSAG